VKGHSSRIEQVEDRMSRLNDKTAIKEKTDLLDKQQEL
jgi:hypothetical protein